MAGQKFDINNFCIIGYVDEPDEILPVRLYPIFAEKLLFSKRIIGYTQNPHAVKITEEWDEQKFRGKVELGELC